MAQVKILQKIPMNTFKGVSDQLKAEGIHIISQGAFKSGKVTQDNIRGRVVSAFNLGAKISVDVESQVCCEGGRFEKLGNVFYLVTK